MICGPCYIARMTEEDIVRAIGLGENEDWEFKDGRGGIGPSVLESVSAFANTLGGVIVCGVLAKDHKYNPHNFSQNTHFGKSMIG